MRRFVLLLAVAPLLALGCQRSVTTNEQDQSTPLAAASPQPETPKAQPAPTQPDPNAVAVAPAPGKPDNNGLADLLKTRYLVLGGVTRFGGWVANARLLDLRTGLVVQTGKVTALTARDLVHDLPNLGKQLLMSDEERQNFEQQKLPQERPVV